MLSQMRLSKKIPLLVSGVAALVGIGVGVSSYLTSMTSMEELTRERLHAAAETAAVELRTYFTTIERELILTAENPGTLSAVQEFAEIWSAMEQSGANPLKTLQSAYITDNPNPTGEKDKLYKAETGTDYDLVHEKYHKWFHALQKDQGYYDVFLFDTKGNLVYSVFKELDYATNFMKGGGEWASSDLGEVFREALKIKEHKEVAFRDFAPYGPSYGAAASFMAHPVVDDHGKTVGVLAFQMPVDRTNELMRHNFGLGETGELALLGVDGLMRNDSVFTPNVNDILSTRLTSDIIDKAREDGVADGYDRLHRDELLRVEHMVLNTRAKISCSSPRKQ